MTVTEKKRRHSPHQPVGRWIRPQKRFEIYWRDDWRCYVCGDDLCGLPRQHVTLDHLIPLVHGGTNHASNLVTCCHLCNSHRQQAPWRDPALKRIAVAHPLNAILDRRMSV